jgi:hypothetical protein
MPKISQLPQIPSNEIDTGSIIPIVDNGVTKRITVGQLVQFANLSEVITDGFVSTSSFNDFSGSVHQRILDATNEQIIDGFATTGSNYFYGDQNISGTIYFNNEGNGAAIGLAPVVSGSGSFFDSISEDLYIASYASDITFLTILNNAIPTGSPDINDVALVSLTRSGSLDVYANMMVSGAVNINSPEPPTLSIGDIFGGGKLAYILQSGDVGYDEKYIRGIIAAESDEETTLEWYNAKETANNKTTNGYGDWHLPSLTELTILYTNRVTIGGFTSNVYWSSTEYDLYGARGYGFGDNSAYSSPQTYTYYVRAIRDFSIPKNALNISGSVTASRFDGDGGGLYNLPSNTNWNTNKEAYKVRNTEQLTFSGDYIIENTNLFIEGSELNNIGEWTNVNVIGNGTTTRTGNNTYRIEGPNNDSESSGWLFIKRYFDTATTMSIGYEWFNSDSPEDWPMYDVVSEDPTGEISNTNRLDNSGANHETGSWTINVPANNWLAIGVYSTDSCCGSGSLHLTLPYILNDDVEYSPGKYFKKEGTIFIGGNLLIKDSVIENDGKISVGGEVILIGDSQIKGTGTII